MTGHTGSSPPLAEQVRELLLQVRRVEALANTLGEEAMERPSIERAVVALRIYDALRGDQP